MEVTLDDIIVTKTGDSSNIENCNLYGQNAAVLVKDGAIATINRAEVTSTASGANALFSYGGARSGSGKSDGTRLDVNNSVITTNGNNSGGLMTTGGGETNAINLTINTSGMFSAPIKSDIGGGKVTVNGGTYTSTGFDSPAIYCMADMTVKDSTLISHNSPAAIIKGKNKLSISDCVITANNQLPVTNSDVSAGILMYDTQKSSGTAELSINGGRFNNSEGHFIHVSNTDAKIILEDIDVYNTDDDNIFLSVSNDGWNGYDNIASVEIRDMSISGHIISDNTPSTESDGKSALNLSLSSSTKFTGAINTNVNEANRGEVNLIVSPGSKFKLTADSYVTSLVNDGIIETNLYTLYVNGEPYEGGTSPEDIPSTLRLDGTDYVLDGNYGNILVTQDLKTSAINIEIINSGTLMITGDSANTTIRVKHDVKNVNLILSSLTIDNSNYAKIVKKDASILILEENADASITLRNHNEFIGPKNYVDFARPIIRGNGSIIKFMGLGVLNIEDSMPETIKFVNKQYPHGIDNPTGQLIFNGGRFNIRSNGHAIQCNKGVTIIDGGDIHVIYSGLDSVNCDDGNIIINMGQLMVDEASRRGISCQAINKSSSGNVIISGGEVILYKIADVGIRGENVTVSGGKVDITNIYSRSGESTYVTGNNIPHKNTIYPVSSTQDKIRINLNVGYHHGIEVGTRGRTYSYVYVPTSDEEHEAGKIYTQAASGSFNLTGGQVRITTIVTGLITRILYTEGYEKCSNDVYVIGGPGHGILCYGTVAISGGQLNIQSAGDGISCDGSVTINGLARVYMTLVYRGITGTNIIIGTSSSSPELNIISTCDSIYTETNQFNYIYDDPRDEDCNYTIDIFKTLTSGNIYMYAGNSDISVDSNNKIQVELRVDPDSTKKIIEYKASGRCMYSNEYVYIDAGETILHGISDASYMAPIKQEKTFILNEDAILLMTSFDSNDKCIPKSGTGVYLRTEDSGLSWTYGAHFKVATPEGQTIYETTLSNPGKCVTFAHPELIYNTLYDLSVNDKTYLLRAKEPLR